MADLDPHRAMPTMVGEGRGYEAADRTIEEVVDRGFALGRCEINEKRTRVM